MNNKFFYPTKRNVLLTAIAVQAFPIGIILSGGKGFNKPLHWLLFELLLISILVMWEIKPNSKFDEREKNILQKWKSRTLDTCSWMVIIPILVLCFNPAISGWNLYIVACLPVLIAHVFCSFMMKHEFGYYFATPEDN